jgi:hypothetical protein
MLMRAIIVLMAMCLFASVASAQRRPVLGSVCGDPTARCTTRENFQPYELPFEYGKNSAIWRSQFFYAVILKSVRLNDDESNCGTAIPDNDLTETQDLFPKNKVFAMRCWESGQNSYTNVADGVSFMGVYAGRSLKEANAFLQKVKATKKYNGAAVRKMRIQINGT